LFERGDPDWTLLGAPAAAGLPAVKWRQQNLDKLTKKKLAELVEALEKVLSTFTNPRVHASSRP
jgi:hypothetical protein